MYNGCPDTDGDGIGDDVDECPNESGVSKYKGCPIPDTDGDGFDDDNDNCPNVAGPLYGCPDRDSDMVADKDDKCPDTPGSVDAAGCPDKDGDGIGDAFDKCPDEAGIPELDGCPKVRKPTKEEIINSYSSPLILFKRGTTPEDDYDAHIASIVEFANAYPEAYLNIGGYSDSQGAESSNMAVSKARAKKVYNSLRKAGIDADRMYYEGYGEADPIADNSTAEGRKMNRRVVVTGSTVKREIPTSGVKK
jgi:outer membrane protein OmpA-like peptidoglycan-associated protein